MSDLSFYSFLLLYFVPAWFLYVRSGSLPDRRARLIFLVVSIIPLLNLIFTWHLLYDDWPYIKKWFRAKFKR
jgi:hypothetical protein